MHAEQRFKCMGMPPSVMTPMRLIVENMDKDHTSRVPVPVALARGLRSATNGGGTTNQDVVDTSASDV